MKIKFTLIILLITLNAIHANEKVKTCNQDSLRIEINSLKQSIKEIDSIHKRKIRLLNVEIEELVSEEKKQNERIDTQIGLIDTGFSGVSTQISASSNIIQIFGVIISIIAIIASIYLTKLEKNVTRMLNDSKILLEENITIKQDMESLSEKITKDSVGLYKIVRNEESNHMLNRLISVPEDIDNLFESLASRDLAPEHFLKLKEAYMQIKGDTTNERNYLTLMFSHFSGKSILDPDIKNEFIKELNRNFRVSFKNDVLKSAKDYFSSLLEVGLTKSRNEINAYLKALCDSRFAENEEVYMAINSVLKDRESKFTLFEIIEEKPENVCFRKIFGKQLIDFQFENLTEKESGIIEAIKELIK